MNSKSEKSKIDLVVIFLGNTYLRSVELLNRLRENDVVFVYEASERSLKERIKFAYKQNAQYALFVTENDLEVDVYPLKNLVSGEESKKSIERLVSQIKDYRMSK